MWLIPFLYVTNFTTGAIIMIIELLGTRFLAPYFGTSLYVWTALITVTLVALAAGYFLGGYLADRSPRASVFYGVLYGAGVFLLAILLIRQPILAASSPSGIFAGTLLAAALLFGPPLLLLGCVSPFTVKLCSRELAGLGSVVGRLYSISTLGSFVGTLAAGFLLIPNFANVTILVFCAVLLAVLASLYFLIFARQALPVIGAAVIGGLAVFMAFRATNLAEGRLGGSEWSWKIIHQANGFYGRISVIDVRAADDTEWKRRYLLNDGLIQGVYDLTNHKPYAAFPFALADLALTPDKAARRVLVLGLGAGFVPRLLKEHGVAEVTTVEINPRMLPVAQEFFGYPSDEAWRKTCPVVIEDARTWVKECTRTFDAIVVDTFLGDNAPGHLLSCEMFVELRRILEPDGVLSMNIFGSMRGDGSRLIAALVRTLREGLDGTGPFPHVQIFSEEATATAHNVYLLAAPAPRSPRPNGIRTVEPPSTVYRLVENAMIDQTADLQGVEKAPILRDDYNAAEYLDVAVRMWIRNDIRTLWGSALLE
jgi:predicted membrane-bound spermidine synthase